MTVAELIEKLNKFNKDTIVSVQGYEDGYTDKISVNEIEVTLNANTEWYYGEHSADDPSEGVKATRVVIFR